MISEEIKELKKIDNDNGIKTIKNMKVHVKTRQFGNGSEGSELLTKGELTIYDTKANTNQPLFTITYDDSSQTGYGDTYTSVSVYKGSKAIINRVNPHSEDGLLIVEAGKKHVTRYGLPIGSADFSVNGVQVVNKVRGTCGYVKLAYSLDSNMGSIGFFAVEISITKNGRINNG